MSSNLTHAADLPVTGDDLNFDPTCFFASPNARVYRRSKYYGCVVALPRGLFACLQLFVTNND
jgi:hypothetical protein